MHCPGTACIGGPFELLKPEDAGWPRGTCPHCDTAVCAHCKVPWHAGMDCAAYQRQGLTTLVPFMAQLCFVVSETSSEATQRCA